MGLCPAAPLEEITWIYTQMDLKVIGKLTDNWYVLAVPEEFSTFTAVRQKLLPYPTMLDCMTERRQAGTVKVLKCCLPIL